MKPIYLVRRKGFDDYMSCSKERFEELGQKDLFETMIAYEAPREWVGLTAFDLDAMSPEDIRFARTIEAKLREKNT